MGAELDGRRALGFLSGRPLTELAPAWIHSPGPFPDLGLAFDCPRCHLPWNDPRPHRLELWFVSPLRSTDRTVGRAVRGLHEHAGTRFPELTVWREVPPPRDPLLMVDHWAGYIERGQVYDALRFAAV